MNTTAAAGHLHRHTVAYRLDRLHELSGLDPRRPEDRERLGLALKAHRVAVAAPSADPSHGRAVARRAPPPSGPDGVEPVARARRPRRRAGGPVALPVSSCTASGKETLNVEPSPGRLSTSTRPSWASTRSRTSARPTPEPSATRSRASGARQKRSNTRARHRGIDADARVGDLEHRVLAADLERDVTRPPGSV